MQIVRIYLVTNCFGDPNKVYIGKEKSPQNGSREYFHKLNLGENINFEYVDEVEGWNKKDWKPLETFWIQYFRFLGFKVLNKNNGGAGPEFVPKEIRDKISKTKKKNYKKFGSKLKGRKIPKPCRGPQSEETCLKKSLKAKGKPKPKGFGDKISKATKGVKKSEEAKQNMRKPKNHGEKIGKSRIGKKYIKHKKFNNNKGRPNPKLGTPILQYDLEGNFIKEWDYISLAAKELGINKNGILQCCQKRSKKSHGYIWKYKNK